MARIELFWDPFGQGDPGPCIYVIVRNSPDVIERGRALGLEYPESRKMRALLDTGASVTVISKTFTKYCKLFQTNEGTELRVLGATYRGGEHAGSVSFPGTNLRTFDLIRIISADFEKEPNYACLIGRDILRIWIISFDGPSKRVTITD
ncbi:MAG: hypothetical protein WA826_18695 [Silvibacterium sp.]